LVRITWLVTALLSIGCGSNSNPAGPSPNPTPPAAFTQTVPGSVSANGVAIHPFAVPRSGNLDMTLTWGNSAVDLDLYLAASSCSSLYPQNACNIMVKSDARGGIVTERVGFSVTAGQTFNIFVDNLDRQRSQDYTLQVTIQ
jgi:hypothetical protein